MRGNRSIYCSKTYCSSEMAYFGIMRNQRHYAEEGLIFVWGNTGKGRVAELGTSLEQRCTTSLFSSPMQSSGCRIPETDSKKKKNARNNQHLET